MKAEKSRIPITDFIKVWCEHCCIRIDAHEERIEVGGKTYHADCYSNLSLPLPSRKVTNTPWISGFREIRALANGLLSIGP